jgi:Family of unknown function (DUF6496)
LTRCQQSPSRDGSEPASGMSNAIVELLLPEDDFHKDLKQRGQSMATQQSKAQKETVGRVMYEFKHGELKTSHGRKVKNPKQAVAIGMHEAGASKYESKEKNRRNLQRTKAREQRGATGNDRNKQGSGREPTRSQLYEEAKRRNIAGRSKMNKDELERALHG